MDETLFEVHPVGFKSSPLEKVLIATRNALTSLLIPGAKFILMDGKDVPSPKLVSLMPSLKGVVIHVWVREDDNVYRETASVEINKDFAFDLSVFREKDGLWEDRRAHIRI